MRFSKVLAAPMTQRLKFRRLLSGTAMTKTQKLGETFKLSISHSGSIRGAGMLIREVPILRHLNGMTTARRFAPDAACPTDCLFQTMIMAG